MPSMIQKYAANLYKIIQAELSLLQEKQIHNQWIMANAMKLRNIVINMHPVIVETNIWKLYMYRLLHHKFGHAIIAGTNNFCTF